MRGSTQSTLSCHDWRRLSSLAFERECDAGQNLFSAKGFVIGKHAERSFGFAVVVIEDSDIAATSAAAKLAGSNVELQTSDTDRLQKGGWIKGTARELIDEGSRRVPLWIKVPPTYSLLPISPWRLFIRRLPTEVAAKQHNQSGISMIPECLTASFVADQAGLWIRFVNRGVIP